MNLINSQRLSRYRRSQTRFVFASAWLLVSAMLAAPSRPADPATVSESPDIPALSWQERSDWINVKTDVIPAAIGNGKADDTAAIQAALDYPSSATDSAKSVYFPPGTYRITDTLVFNGPATGCLVVGHGRLTRIVWDGSEGGRMFQSNGVAYSRYVGLTWDGQGKAAVGFDHASKKRFETEVRHEHEAFRNFTGFGIRVGHQQKVASAEILYRNCLFENCGTALAFLTFNDYDNTIDRCEFRNCGTGIYDSKGNFYARNSHFENSRVADFVVTSEHGSSIRRCTSIGSRRFIEERGGIAPLTVQDCHVADWKDPSGAVHLNGSPVLLFDCSFTRPPSDRPPVRLARPTQIVFVSNNRPEEKDSLLQYRKQARIYVLPKGSRNGIVVGPEERFLEAKVAAEGRVFDTVKEFGAKGDGKADDTQPIQAAIDAAREAGDGAVAYLPAGRYRVNRTIRLTGRNYTWQGSGFRCGLLWRGPAGAPMVTLSGVQNVTLAHLAIGSHDLGKMNHGDDIRVISPPGQPCHLILDEVYGFGMYQRKPNLHGIHFLQLPKGSVIEGRQVQGNLRFTDSARATFLFRTSYEGTITVEGNRPERDGFLGFLTRLATKTHPALQIRDNHSIVMSDFYVEQSDQFLVLEGKPRQPKGSVTIQGAKLHTFTQMPLIDIRNYSGRIYFGQSQFYIAPKEPRFISKGTAPSRLILAGHFWYKTKPRFELGPEVALTLIGNLPIEDIGISSAAMTAMAGVLDDLRRLGKLDLDLSFPLDEEE